MYTGEDGKGKLLFAEARGVEQSRQQQIMASDSHLRDTLSSVLDPGSQSCSLLAGHNQETNKKHIHEYVTITYFQLSHPHPCQEGTQLPLKDIYIFICCPMEKPF